MAILFVVYLPGHPEYYQALLSILGKAYANSMLAALNSRMRVISALPPQWDEKTTSNDDIHESPTCTNVTASVEFEEHEWLHEVSLYV